ncbi:polymorphic toxin-type HINT domain-containing protein [Aeoliella sp. SH292]|uniref:polymorphic toxin-type HINT domain-containing protein n=1 Tax=Aeoliella sp. SH292 TaxID=3454464 RepID=UPI003F94E515
MRTTFPICLAIGFTVSSLSSAGDNVASGIAERMTREALAAGAAGETELREDLLDQALRVAPDHAPARWAKGQIEQDGEWKSIGVVQEEARANTRRDEYQAMKSQAPEGSAAQLELAKWCQRNNLADEARYHWLNVLTADPQNKDALRALDSDWFEGRLLPRDEVADLKLDQRERRKAEGTWRARIAGWDRAIKSGGDEAERALADVEATVDESAIPEFEKLAINTRKRGPGQASRNAQLCEAYVSALERLPSYEASLSLARLAVLADDSTLQLAAMETLKQRPTYEVLPMLFTGLTPVIESRFDITRSENGLIQYTHEMVAEGADVDYVAETSTTVAAPVVVIEGASAQAVQRALNRSEMRQYTAAQQMAREAQRLEEMAASANATREQLNGRIVAVLRTLTGKDYSDNPREWWDYWREENGYDEYRETVAYRADQSYDLTEIVAPPIQTGGGGGGYECFAAGTLVWTKTGMQEIETLRAGDIVLTMDEQTGERSFRPVLRTTLRPPGPMMHLATSNYQIVCTPGHPFWVEGTGWRMAKELSVGDRITTATGAPLELRAVASAEEEQQAFNLVVEGNNNYFVGQDGLLSHDNTQRRPELARAAQR